MTIDYTNQFRSLLREYGVEPEFVEDLGRVKKIHSNYGMLALKKINLPYNQLSQYENNLQFLHENNYGIGVPIYRTRRGNSFVFDQEYKAYYLMPWLQPHREEERNDHAFYLFKQLGELHANTVKEQKINDGEADAVMENIKGQWQNRMDEMEAFVQKCEENTYMSPFELYFCTYYQDLIRAKEFAAKKLDEWKEMMSNQSTYRTVFTHGKPSLQHFLYNAEGQGVFINFEKSGYSPPINDLLYFFYRSCKSYPFQTDDRFQWFQTYQKHFPLSEDELTMFIAYLAYPENLYGVFYRYKTDKRNKSELKHLQLLQRAFWQMKNIEYFLTSIVMLEEEKKRKEQQESQVQ
jgi:spore coat protein YsxE